jgi:hypothetical protein
LCQRLIVSILEHAFGLSSSLPYAEFQADSPGLSALPCACNLRSRVTVANFSDAAVVPTCYMEKIQV